MSTYVLIRVNNRVFFTYFLCILCSIYFYISVVEERDYFFKAIVYRLLVSSTRKSRKCQAKKQTNQSSLNLLNIFNFIANLECIFFLTVATDDLCHGGLSGQLHLHKICMFFLLVDKLLLRQIKCRCCHYSSKKSLHNL